MGSIRPNSKAWKTWLSNKDVWNRSRSVWAHWIAATRLTSSPGSQNGCSSCFQGQGLNSRANLYSSDGFENGAPALRWRERGVYSVCTSLLERLMQTSCSHADLLFSIWQRRNHWAMLVSAILDRYNDRLFSLHELILFLTSCKKKKNTNGNQ